MRARTPKERKPQRVPSLGPFAMMPVDIRALGLRVVTEDDGRRSFQVDLRHKSLDPLVESAELSTRQGTGTVFPVAPVTLDEKTRKIANIPLDAAFFAFASPVAGVTNLSGRLVNFADPLVNFCGVGGYLYFAKYDTLVGATTLFKTPEYNHTRNPGGLYFDGPFPFGRSEVVERLLGAGRFSPPTLTSLAVLGVTAFCWLNPSEHFSPKSDPYSEDGSAWTHGAFVYIYDANPSLNCYFRAVPAPKSTATVINECFRETDYLYADFLKQREQCEERWRLPPLQKKPLYVSRFSAANRLNEDDARRMFPSEARLRAAASSPSITLARGHSGERVFPPGLRSPERGSLSPTPMALAVASVKNDTREARQRSTIPDDGALGPRGGPSMSRTWTAPTVPVGEELMEAAPDVAPASWRQQASTKSLVANEPRKARFLARSSSATM